MKTTYSLRDGIIYVCKNKICIFINFELLEEITLNFNSNETSM